MPFLRVINKKVRQLPNLNQEVTEEKLGPIFRPPDFWVGIYLFASAMKIYKRNTVTFYQLLISLNHLKIYVTQCLKVFLRVKQFDRLWGSLTKVKSALQFQSKYFQLVLLTSHSCNFFCLCHFKLSLRPAFKNLQFLYSVLVRCRLFLLSKAIIENLTEVLK